MEKKTKKHQVNNPVTEYVYMKINREIEKGRAEIKRNKNKKKLSSCGLADAM